MAFTFRRFRMYFCLCYTPIQRSVFDRENLSPKEHWELECNIGRSKLRLETTSLVSNLRWLLWPIMFALALIQPGGPAFAQDPVGGAVQQNLPLGPNDYKGGINDIVNPATGSLSLRFQVPLPPGRGLNIPFSINYDTNGIWHAQPIMQNIQTSLTIQTYTYGVAYLLYQNYIGNGQTNNPPFYENGWSYPVPQYSVIDHDVVGNYPETDCYWASDYQFSDPSGGQHPLLLGIVSSQDRCNAVFSQRGQQAPQNYLSGGDNQFRASIDNQYAYLTPTVFGLDGTSYQFTGALGTLPSSLEGQAASTHYGLASQIEDRNGNLITIDQNGPTVTYIDTLERNLLNISSFMAPTDSISVAGISTPYKVTWSNISTSSPPPNYTSFPSYPFCQGSGGSGVSNSIPAITNIVLPNGDTYTFSYDQVYGLVNKITYPTGAWISYKWAPNSQSVEINTSFISTAPGYVGDLTNCVTRYDTPAVQERDVSYNGQTIALKQIFTYSTIWGDANNNFDWTSKTTSVTDYDNVANTSSVTTYTYLPVPAPVDPNTASYAVEGESAPIESTVQYDNQITKTEAWANGSWMFGDKKACEVDTLNGVSSGTFTTYTNYSSGSTSFLGGPNEVRVYDYGSVSPSDCQHFAQLPSAQGYPVSANWPQANALTDTTISYQAFQTGSPYSPPNYNIPTLLLSPNTVTVTGAGGNTSVTTYGYDATPVTSYPSVVSHDETSYGSNRPYLRANVTSVSTLQNNGLYAVTSYTYDETGNKVSIADADGNPPTTLTYDPQSGYGYLSQVTRPPTNGVNHVTLFQHSNLTGQLTEITDENSQSTSFFYNDPLGRLTSSAGPSVNGQTPVTQYAYVDGTSPSMQITDPTGVQNQTLYDGFGRPTLSTLLTDPQGPAYSLTTYDGEGNAHQSWNPTRCKPTAATACPGETTFGTTTYGYDSLHRKLTAVHSLDGTSQTWNYNANLVTAIDEAGKASLSTYDGAGRLSSVLEATSSSITGPITTYQGPVTTYHYDALSNLKSIIQNGVAGDIPRTRGFSYDGMSRMTASTNPETGTICYGTVPNSGLPNPSNCSANGYDANGNLLYRTDARGLTTAYQYDVLNRMVRFTVPVVNLSGAVPNQFQSTCYQYDSLSSAQTTANLIGRLTAEWTQSGTSCDPSYTPADAITAKVILTYDPMGRPLLSQQCVLTQCTTNPFTQNQMYDLAGNMTSWTDGRGYMTFGQGIDTAGRTTSLTNTVSSGGFPSVLFSAQSYTAAGTLQNWKVGGFNAARNFDGRMRVTSESVTH